MVYGKPAQPQPTDWTKGKTIPIVTIRLPSGKLREMGRDEARRHAWAAVRSTKIHASRAERRFAKGDETKACNEYAAAERYFATGKAYSVPVPDEKLEWNIWKLINRMRDLQTRITDGEPEVEDDRGQEVVIVKLPGGLPEERLTRRHCRSMSRSRQKSAGYELQRAFERIIEKEYRLCMSNIRLVFRWLEHANAYATAIDADDIARRVEEVRQQAETLRMVAEGHLHMIDHIKTGHSLPPGQAKVLVVAGHETRSGFKWLKRSAATREAHHSLNSTAEETENALRHYRAERPRKAAQSLCVAQSWIDRARSYMRPLLDIPMRSEADVLEQRVYEVGLMVAGQTKAQDGPH